MIIQVTAKVPRESWEDQTTMMKKKLIAESLDEQLRVIPVSATPVANTGREFLALFAEFTIISMDDRAKLLQACREVLKELPDSKKAHTIFDTQIKPLLL